MIEYRDHLVGVLARIEGLPSATDALGDGLVNSELIAKPGDVRQLLAEMQASAQGKLDALSGNVPN